MPAIAINLGQVESFESLPFGTYYGELEAVIYKPASQQGKFPQLQARYIVLDGEQLGRRQSEWLSLSPKALFRLKAWLIKFGVGDNDEVIINDESPDDPLTPDLTGSKVVFMVFQDPKDASRIRTELQSVEETTFRDAVPAVRVQRPAPARQAPSTPTSASRRVVAQPAPAPVAEGQEELGLEDIPETAAPAPAPAPTPRRAVAPAAPAAAAARRTLR
jgi:hypothetical protein